MRVFYLVYVYSDQEVFYRPAGYIQMMATLNLVFDNLVLAVTMFMLPNPHVAVFKCADCRMQFLVLEEEK